MLLHEYRQEFLADLQARASVAANFTHNEFTEVCAEMLGDAEELSDFEACYYRGSGSRKRALAIDGFAQDDVDGSIRLIVANFSGAQEIETITQTEARTSFNRLTAFCEDVFSGRLLDDVDESTPAHSAALTLQQLRKQISRLRMYLVTDSALSTKVKDWPEAKSRAFPWSSIFGTSTGSIRSQNPKRAEMSSQSISLK